MTAEGALIIITFYTVGAFVSHSIIKDILGYDSGAEKTKTRLAVVAWPVALPYIWFVL